MDLPAILLLEGFKPLVFVTGELGRFFLAPFLGAFGIGSEISTHEYITVLEDRKNIDRLIKRIEELKETKRKKDKQDKLSTLQRLKSWFRSSERPKTPK